MRDNPNLPFSLAEYRSRLDRVHKEMAGVPDRFCTLAADYEEIIDLHDFGPNRVCDAVVDRLRRGYRAAA